MGKSDFLGVVWRHLIAHLEEMEQLLKGIAVMKELTLRTRDYLVSFGECMSTRIFAAYLNKIGIKAHQVRNILLQLCFFFFFF
jgi:aspartate kinase